jgi:hypothetical protein
MIGPPTYATAIVKNINNEINIKSSEFNLPKLKSFFSIIKYQNKGNKIIRGNKLYFKKSAKE